MGSLSDHYHNIEADYQSGTELPHSKGSADLIYAKASGYMRRMAIIICMVMVLAAPLCLSEVNPSQRQVIDRNDSALTMIYSTFLGGSQVDDCDAIATDPRGNIYLGCHSDSPNLPGSASAPYALKGDLDAFVIKLDPDASQVLYLAHIGGGEWECPMGIAVDSAGFAYITGSTYSPDFPTTAGAFQRAFAGDSDAFVVKVSPNGSVVYPVVRGMQNAFGGGTYDIVVAKFARPEQRRAAVARGAVPTSHVV